MGLDGGEVNDTIHDVRALKVAHIRVTEGRETAEAEHIPDAIQSGREADGLLILDAVVCCEFDFLSGLGDLEFVQAHQLVPVQEDDGLVGCFELGLESLIGCVGIVSLAGGPVQEPFEIAPLLLHGYFPLIKICAMIIDILAEDGFREQIKASLRIPGLNVAFDNVEGALGGWHPHIVDALLLDELFETLEESGLLGLFGGG